jgi:hypothetical protein
MIANAMLEDLNSRIVEIIQTRMELRQRGRKFYGLCPFHGDRRPSFEVNPNKSAWFCNVCGLGGDAIAFVMKFENIRFPEALKRLGFVDEPYMKEKNRSYMLAAEKIRDAEAAYLAQHSKKYNVLCALSRDVNCLINDGTIKSVKAVELFMEKEFQSLENQKFIMSAHFEHLRDELRKKIYESIGR